MTPSRKKIIGYFLLFFMFYIVHLTAAFVRMHGIWPFQKIIVVSFSGTVLMCVVFGIGFYAINLIIGE